MFEGRQKDVSDVSDELMLPPSPAVHLLNAAPASHRVRATALECRGQASKAGGQPASQADRQQGSQAVRNTTYCRMMLQRIMILICGQSLRIRGCDNTITLVQCRCRC